MIRYIIVGLSPSLIKGGSGLVHVIVLSRFIFVVKISHLSFGETFGLFYEK